MGSKENSKLLLRFVYLTLYAGAGSIEPFMPLLFTRRGYGASAVGLVLALQPFAQSVAAPIWASIADRTGAHARVSIVAAAAAACLSAAVAVASESRNLFILCLAAASLAAARAPLAPLADSASMAVRFSLGRRRPVIKPQLSTQVLDGDSAAYGRLRLFGGFGYGAAGMLLGLVLDGKRSDYVAWLSFSVLTAAAGVASGLALNSPAVKQQAASSRTRAVPLLEATNTLLRRHGVLRFLVTVFVMGLSNSAIATFVPLLVTRELGAGSDLVGISVVISIFSEAPCFFWSRELMRSVGGTKGAIATAHIVTVIRLVGHAFAPTALLAVMPQALHGGSFALMWTGSVIYAASIAPASLSATMQAVVAACYYGLGGGVAALVGGVLYDSMGPRNMFIGIGALVSFSLYLFSSAMSHADVEPHSDLDVRHDPVDLDVLS